MNMALLERHAHEERPAAAGDWLFVLGIIAALVLIALLPFALVIWIFAHWWR
jgi:hypothetical protein